MIVNHLLEIYLLMWISVFIHEISHIIVAKIIKMDIFSVHIGDEFFAVHIGKIYLSLMIIGGSYVEFYEKDLKEKNKGQIAGFFLAGPLANVALALGAYIFKNIMPIYMDILFWVNIYYFIFNIIPFLSKTNDLEKMKKYLLCN